MKKQKNHLERHGIAEQDMSALKNYLEEGGWKIMSKSENHGLMSISAIRETDTFKEEMSKSEQTEVDENNVITFQSTSYFYSKTEKKFK